MPTNPWMMSISPWMLTHRQVIKYRNTKQCNKDQRIGVMYVHIKLFE